MCGTLGLHAQAIIRTMMVRHADFRAGVLTGQLHAAAKDRETVHLPHQFSLELQQALTSVPDIIFAGKER